MKSNSHQISIVGNAVAFLFRNVQNIGKYFLSLDIKHLCCKLISFSSTIVSTLYKHSQYSLLSIHNPSLHLHNADPLLPLQLCQDNWLHYWFYVSTVVVSKNFFLELIKNFGKILSEHLEFSQKYFALISKSCCFKQIVHLFT